MAGRHVSDISFEILYIEFNKNPFNGGAFEHRRRELQVKYYVIQLFSKERPINFNTEVRKSRFQDIQLHTRWNTSK